MTHSCESLHQEIDRLKSKFPSIDQKVNNTRKWILIAIYQTIEKNDIITEERKHLITKQALHLISTYVDSNKKLKKIFRKFIHISLNNFQQRQIHEGNQFLQFPEHKPVYF